MGNSIFIGKETKEITIKEEIFTLQLTRAQVGTLAAAIQDLDAEDIHDNAESIRLSKDAYLHTTKEVEQLSRDLYSIVTNK